MAQYHHISSTKTALISRNNGALENIDLKLSLKGKTMSLQEEFNSRLAGVKNNYRKRLVEYETEIFRLIEIFDNSNTDMTPVKQIQFLVHKMQGPSKTLGFEAVGICASNCEAHIDRLLFDPSSNITKDAFIESLESLLVCLARSKMTNTPRQFPKSGPQLSAPQ